VTHLDFGVWGTPGSRGQVVGSYLCTLFMPKPPDQSPPNFAQASTPTQGRFLTQAWPCQPNPWTQGYLKLQNPNASREKKLCFTKNVQMGNISSSNFSRTSNLTFAHSFIIYVDGTQRSQSLDLSLWYFTISDHVTFYPHLIPKRPWSARSCLTCE